MAFHLFMALFWLVLGAALLLWPLLNPNVHLWTIRGTDFSLGWVGIVLALYNLVRWYSVRSYRAQQRSVEAARLREREQELANRRRLQEPDPNFTFTPKPPDETRPKGD